MGFPMVFLWIFDVKKKLQGPQAVIDSHLIPSDG